MNSSGKRPMIYADYAATTPLDKRVLEAMMPYLTNVFFNASSTHAAGMEAQRAVMKARMTVAKHIAARMDEIVFTSGATEAISLAVLGLFRKQATPSRQTFVTCATEHMAMIDVAHQLEAEGYSVRFVGVDEHGVVDMDEVRSVLDESTLLLSVMAVNNETGVKQDLKTLAELAHNVGALFMTDATQAYGKMPIHVDELGIDLMSFSAHKIYGPKGVGALFQRKRDRDCTLQPLQYGGGQEGGVRSGTLNVPGVVGLAEAGSLALSQLEQEQERIGALRDAFERGLTSLGVTINGFGAPRSYNISNITVPDATAHELQNILDHVACSQGSACSSAKTTPSHVLTAMGRTPEQTDHSLRFSFGRYSTQQEVADLVLDITSALEHIRATHAEHHTT